MDGILLVIKPPGMTSFDVVAWLRRVLKIKKIGHGGTLDPAAVGLLPVCLGKATRAIEQFLNFDKSYRAEMVLGIVTDTQDAEGKIIEKKAVTVGNEAIIDAVRSFTGKYEQIPPMFSAIKINGKKLYDLARQGIEVERKPREVHIRKIDIIDIKRQDDTVTVKFDVDCSKGTYIRTLCHDIGQKLGCGAYMSSLIRTCVGPFSITEGVTLEEINRKSEEGTLSSVIKPVDVLYRDYKDVILEGKFISRFLNGAAVVINNNSSEINERLRVYSENGLFLGIGRIIPGQGKKLLRAEKVFASLTKG